MPYNEQTIQGDFFFLSFFFRSSIIIFFLLVSFFLHLHVRPFGGRLADGTGFSEPIEKNKIICTIYYIVNKNQRSSNRLSGDDCRAIILFTIIISYF